MTGSHKFRALFWPGYGELPDTYEQETPFENPPYFEPELELEYYEATITADDLKPGDYPPSFVWDAHGEFAWGSLVYPDSLFVAAAPEIFRMIHQSPLVDVVSVTRGDIEVPPSAGD